MSYSFPRVAALLGAPVELIGEAHLIAAIAAKARETVDLDWKGAGSYPPNEKGKNEIAKDVSAMANSGGGVLVYGMAEDKQGCAHALEPVALDQSEQRIREVVASRVFPLPEVSLFPVAVSGAQPGTGCHIIAIPPSSMAPHAMRLNERPSFAYAVRNGTTTLYLSETGIAERYRSRFALAQDRVRQLADVSTSGRALVERKMAADDIMLCTSAIPDSPAQLQMNRRFLASAREFFDDWRQSQLPYPLTMLMGVTPVAGRRKVVFADRSSTAEFYTDGSSFAAVTVGNPLRDNQPPVLRPDLLEMSVLTLTSLLAFYASWAGAAGDAVVAAFLMAQTKIQIAEYPSQDGIWPGETIFEINSREAELTMPIAAVVSDPPELVAAARSLAADLLSDFRVPEPEILTAENSVNASHVLPPAYGHVRQWALSRGVAVAGR